MALLGTIRNKFGAVIMGLIFLGILSFLFMDISPSGNGLGGRSMTVGYVNGDKISNDLVQEYSQNFQNGQYLAEQIQEQVWNQIVREKLMDRKVMEAGFSVTADEMGDMFVSPDPSRLSSTIRNYFGDRQTGMVNTDDIKQRIEYYHNTTLLLKQATTPKQREEMLEQQKNWLSLEKSVKQERLQSKYFDAIGMGVYTPTWMVEMEHKTQEAAYTFDYVRIPYTNISDKIEVTDAEMNAYIAAHPRQYKREATANIEYVMFDVTPTAKDSAEYRQEMLANAKSFAEAKSITEDSAVVARLYGQFPANYYTKEELSEPQSIVDSVFASATGTVFGPYINNNKYVVLKKVESKGLPDSVRSRHILIQTNSKLAARATPILDSLKKVLLTTPGASFDSLAFQFSEDGSREKGGDLGWKAKDGSFVPEFEEYMFYTGKKDSLQLVYTRFGVHLLQITDYKFETNKSGVRIAKVEKDIIPSGGTSEDKQREVVEFITNNRKSADVKAAAKQKGLTVNPASGLQQGGYIIPGIGAPSGSSTAADIIRWAHNPETEIGVVTNRPYALENTELNYTEKFIVTVLVSRTPKGLATLDDPQVRSEVDRILRNQKKTEVVKAKLAKITSLDALAGEYSLIRETATNVKYSAANLGGAIGVEPKVLALAAATEAGKMSGAVGGKEGVYVLQVTSKIDAQPITNVKASRDQITGRIAQIVSERTIFEGLKEVADIQDDRSNY